MQTFLPYADFHKSAAVLDYKRLGKQRVEAIQILNAIQGKSKGWVNHPCVKMWRGFEHALLDYADAMIQEWVKQGYKNTIDVSKLREQATGSYNLPWWFGKEKFHISHQSNLLRKDYAYYSVFFPDVPDNLEYYWP